MADMLTAEAGGSVLAARYVARMAAGDIAPDSGQAKVVAALAQLEQRIASRRLARKSSALGWLFARREDTIPRVRGLYIHGAVGRGKTMLADLFFESVAVRKRKRRAHFHEFMADVHARIFKVRADMKAGRIKEADPIALVAAALYEEAWLLCFDEFHVTDIADAMILGRLFEKLFDLGVVIVATSNVAPEDLYKGGLNRALFLPFIAMIEKHMEVVRIESPTDYRMEKLGGVRIWFVPDDDHSMAQIDREMEKIWHRIAGNDGGAPASISSAGRLIRVPRAGGGAARFSFEDLCAAALGASDYLRIARTYHTVVIDHIPQLDQDRRNEAKRFITLIDEFYEKGVKLVASAAAEPEDLYLGTEGAEAFEWARTVSRLHEMRSSDYIARPHGRGDSEASGDTTGLVET
ncbi:cell division protein ZapE [Ancylobacter amanitiformis]|uniref:Cell division protein ZapE n=1 Tax=Ancylobacter amanitiformis TaxID=217069 RepID=A0ABU0LRZ8_9HYPH|nr:cell division protein ZapE [Ancylobacter amanitiformis]MDQ0511487.1 cell division protein ZapE [Ancylobacter amanitiformis]